MSNKRSDQDAGWLHRQIKQAQANLKEWPAYLKSRDDEDLVAGESRPRKCPRCERELSTMCSECYAECSCGWSEGRNSLEKYLDKEDWWL